MLDRNHSAFAESVVDRYDRGPPRQVPGYASLHSMVSLLLAERIGDTGRVLVLGAGGGQEIKALADAHAGWSFDGIDPSADMLRLAMKVVGRRAGVRLHHGFIADAPERPFDGATCLLTFHFIPREQRLETLRQVRARLKNGAPLVLAHLSFPQAEPERSRWIDRHVAYGLSNGADPADIDVAREAIAGKLTILSPDEEVAMLAQAGFAEVSLFYAGLSMKGWVAYAA